MSRKQKSFNYFPWSKHSSLSYTLSLTLRQYQKTQALAIAGQYIIPNFLVRLVARQGKKSCPLSTEMKAVGYHWVLQEETVMEATEHQHSGAWRHHMMEDMHMHIHAVEQLNDIICEWETKRRKQSPKVRYDVPYGFREKEIIYMSAQKREKSPSLVNEKISLHRRDKWTKFLLIGRHAHIFMTQGHIQHGRTQDLKWWCTEWWMCQRSINGSTS